MPSCRIKELETELAATRRELDEQRSEVTILTQKREKDRKRERKKRERDREGEGGRERERERERES